MTENDPGHVPPPAPSGFEAATPPPAAAPPPTPSYASAPPAAPGVGRVTNTMAIVTLIAGIGGLTFLPFIGSIVAVITGPMSEKQIAQNGEDGAQLAKVGKILGWVGIGLWVLGIIGIVLFYVVLAASVATS
ncbi:MAG: DUF4190 domain-containing protein [Actinomycetales bacterium]|nr:DUF4190 domain-containing protein [Actinomycetales bacterium]